MYHKERRYTSDVSDEQWQALRPLLPLEHEGAGRPLELDMRAVVHAVPGAVLRPRRQDF